LPYIHAHIHDARCSFSHNSDPGGRYFLSAASNYSVPIITAFVNSAPHPFTTNNLSCAGSFATGTEAAYGKYIADVIGHFRSVEGVNVSYVSLFNEPDDRYVCMPPLMIAIENL
jgi:O-glycosyl hydrolase